MGVLLHDLRFAFRQLRKRPGFVLVATLSLGLAIGATATIFTWMDGLVLRPFPEVQEPERLVRLYTRGPGGSEMSTSHPDFRDWRERSRAFEGIAASSMAEFGLRGSGEEEQAERVWGLYASDNYFEVLGVRPLLGRGFLPEDGTAGGAAPVAVLGYGLWQRRFGGDPAVVGRQVLLNNQSFTVVGVAPPRFGGTFVGLGFDLWVPLATLPLLAEGTGRLEWRASRWLDLIGRLQPGVTLEQARAEMSAIGQELAREHPDVGAWAPAVLPLESDRAAHEVLRPVFLVLLGMTGLVLLIACANVANLLLTRAASRQRELGIRLAIGASRERLVRQLLTESLLLALLGGLLGMTIAWWGSDLISWFMPPSPYPIDLTVELNRRVLALAVGLTLGTTLLFGLLPALRASRPALMPALRDRPDTGSSGRSRLRGALVVAQVALAVVTLVGAGLFVRTLREAQQVDPGFRDPASVLLVSTNLRLAGHAEAEAQVLTESLLERAATLPGVQSAAAASTVPLGFGGWSMYDVGVEGYQPRPQEGMSFMVNSVSAGYFATLGIPLLRGRAIGVTDRPDGERVAVVNETFAQRFWPGQDAVGRRIELASRPLTVVGVAADGKYGTLTEAPSPFVYLPLTQWYRHEVTLHLRTAGDPGALLGPLRHEFTALDPGLPFLEPRTLEQHMGAAVAQYRLAATLLSIFGALALLLAVIGLYGVIAYAVAQRTREIGIRMALGAASRDVLAVFLRDGARLTAFGLVLGLAGALGLAQLLRSQLVGISPADPLAFGTAALLLTAVALLASYLPARRATRVDPMVALRAE